MRCPTCHGTGNVVRQSPVCPDLGLWSNYEVPCQDCGGSGITHCCEGMREQAEDETAGSEVGDGG